MLWLGVTSGFLRCLACSLFCRAISSQFSFCLVPPFRAPACNHMIWHSSELLARSGACQMPY